MKRTKPKMNAIVLSTIKIPQDSLCNNKMDVSRKGHKLKNLMICKAKVKPSKSEIMKRASKATINMRIS